ncbi:restriction endonuclease subunit S [Staphylococcus borealis]|uniref:restriction endonuclease subunit S n=1 Tax=Staphylococcus borealis TaxID=2742203 RepID=UPI002DB867C4|nr:restriction endonuclease subunit S [Staphylococcus borealis]MEB7366710.1 restriction endonuclease subunit S [Staphylococcus borealis]MEB7460185.1 restriction endonuclease subunit S [Staphylococcus borealis]
MTEHTNTPELRFPEFSDEWSNEKVNTFLKESKIKGHKGNNAKKLTVKLWGKGVVEKKQIFKGSNNTQYYIRKAGQLMYGKLDFLNCAFGIVPNELDNYESTIDSPSFDFIKGDQNFLLERIKMKSFYKKYGDIANGSRKAKRINQDTFLSMSLYAPNIIEQEKIGSFFSKLDRQIELEEEKLELLEQQKKGYMQKIFSQELRFKDEKGNDYTNWVTRKIKEIGSVYTGNTPSKKKTEYWDSRDYIWITPTDINEKKNLKNSEYMLSDKGFKKARQLPENTLLITCIASIGKNAILRVEGSCNQQINALIPNNDNNVDFLYYAFEKVSKYMKRIAGKTATQIVNKSTFENISIELPNFEEQLKIGRFLNSFDKLIEKQSSKIELLNQRKQGLLQKMFV